MPHRLAVSSVLAVTLLFMSAVSLMAGDVILDETAAFRHYYRFATDLVSPEAMRAEGDKVVDATLIGRLKKELGTRTPGFTYDGFWVMRPSPSCLRLARKVGSAKALGDANTDPAGADWRDYVFVRMFHDPYTAPPPPDGWAAADFDDSAWPLDRGTFQVDMPNDLPPGATEGNMSKIHIGVLQYLGTGLMACYYRATFAIDDVSKAGEITLKMVYRGGVRVMVNGQEVARGHLPNGDLAADTPGDDYPEAAWNDASLRDRTIGPVKIAPSVLRKGANVLAIENRASLLHPAILKKQQSRSWNALHDRECLWRHAHVSRLELRSGGATPSALTRPAGVQVWVQDMHHRVESTEFAPAGQLAPVVKIVAARNGRFSAQIVVGSDKALAGLTAKASELKQDGGSGVIPAAAVEVRNMLPFPKDEFTPEKLGDERGLGATFPSKDQLAKLETIADPRKTYIYDHITQGGPADVVANTCRPLWVTVRTPADIPPGTYKGTVELAAQGMIAVAVPVEVAVIGFALPAPKDFETYVGCEENPYAVAKQYNVPLWSKEHLALVDASLRQLGRAGGTWLNVPILRATEFGNKEDSMVRWISKKDGTMSYDYTVLDKYLDLAVKALGRVRMINFVVMQGMNAGLKPPPQPEVNILDEATGKTSPMAMASDKRKQWQDFARSLHAHMQQLKLDGAMHWGFPADGETDHELVVALNEAVPSVRWTAAPHQAGYQGFKDLSRYDVMGTVRYFNNMKDVLKLDRPWASPIKHLTIPRIDSSVQSLHTASHPFAYRVLIDHSLNLGRLGFMRVGADEWAGAHFDGMKIPQWIVGMPVLFMLWPGKDGAESSARFEALIEGIQEGEASIRLMKNMDPTRVGAGKPFSEKADPAGAHYLETCFFQNKLCIFELEKYHYRWQERSGELFQAAAVAGK
ncbi:MAG: glycoside hydrolase domain-containing protein [Phycisphaerae bacterium]